VTPSAPIRAFVEELVRAGVREAVICPGSRSAPMALALAAHEGLRVTVLLDERSAGYFALGMARTAGRPVVLLSTSGTAAVNFAPAVVEASLVRAPLVVVTADRPVELRDRGAPQTIDQRDLFGRHAKWWTELPVPSDDPVVIAHLRSVAGRAVATASAAPAGPVHLDAPYREPLVPDGPLGAWPELPGRFVEAVAGVPRLDADVAQAVGERLAGRPRGLIVAGPTDAPGLAPAVVELAAATGYPILADPLSGLRAGTHDRSLVLARGDQLVRPGPWIDAHRPDLVVRLGAMPTSKPLVELLMAATPELYVVDGGGGWREAAIVPATFLHANETATAGDLAAAVRAARASTGAAGGPEDDGWGRDWLAADTVADRVMTSWLADLDEPFEGLPFAVLPDVLPDGAVVWAGNSMPVRDLDGWLPSAPRAWRLLSNRGANGIDGVVSTALGSAAVAGGPVVLVVGDVSFLHDLGALVTARLTRVGLTIVLVANDGGGIFSFLPQARTDDPAVGLPERYELLFGTPHGTEIGPLVEALGLEHRRVDRASLADAIRDSLDRPGPSMLELRTDRARNLELHRAASAAVSAALTELVAATGGTP
jgi:2-succinyl-5-enolpyruvyl-6-hydroxy-3-cyclohexene-1-carboxylate synthase